MVEPNGTRPSDKQVVLDAVFELAAMELHRNGMVFMRSKTLHRMNGTSLAIEEGF